MRLMSGWAVFTAVDLVGLFAASTLVALAAVSRPLLRRLRPAAAESPELSRRRAPAG
jgi:hypothetical protein